MVRVWLWAVLFCVSLGSMAWTGCPGHEDEPITMFRIGGEVYGSVLGDGGRVVGIDAEADEVIVEYEFFPRPRRKPTGWWSLRCGCLDGFCIGDSVDHLLMNDGRSVVWAINYSYKKLIVRSFFLDSFQDYYPRELRHVPRK